jgi:hypothetical protein
MLILSVSAGPGETGGRKASKDRSRVKSSKDFNWDAAVKRKKEISKRAEESYRRAIDKLKAEKARQLKEERDREKRLRNAVRFHQAVEKKGKALSDRQKALEASIQRKLEERAKRNRKRKAQEEPDEEDY